MAFCVRQATVNDIPQLVQFQLAMAQESEGTQLDVTRLTQGVQRVFDSPGLGQYWVLAEETTQTLAGMCMVTTEWSDWHNRFYWWFQSVYIQPEYRGQGGLEALMNQVKQAAREENAQELRLYVESENERAIRAYQKLGFSQGHYQVMQKQV